MLTDRLCHIEVPRTGGRFFRSICRRVPGLRICDPHTRGMHTDYARFVKDAEECGIEMPPAAVWARNPKSYYVSAWCWTTENDYRGLGEISFRGYLEILRHQKIRGWPFWPLSQIWEWIGADNAVYFYKFENLLESLRSVMLATMADLISETEIDRLLAESPSRNRSLIYPTKGPLSAFDPRPLWTEETRGWALEWDGKLMERFGYEF